MDKETQTHQLFRENAQNELTEHLVYGRLAAMERNAENRSALARLSEEEKKHYEFWQTLIPETKIRPRYFTLHSITFLRMLFGVTFITKFLETHENNAVEKYEGISNTIPESHRQRFAQIIEDEKSHERALIGQLKEKRVSYLGFIVLGLADAIVEITGVHAGFLGVTGSTLIAGVSSHGVTVEGRVAAGDMMLELALDVGEQA